MLDTQISADNLISEAQNKLKTVRDLVRFGVSLFNQHKLFYGHGTTNPHDEAVYLILHSLNLPLDVLEPYLDARLLESEVKFILQCFHKRAVNCTPAPYITNHALFQGYDFYVDERVIIPRSFIPEIMLNDGLLPWVEHPELVRSVLDLCTGNGSIATIAADYFYDSEVIASDIDNDALEVATINIKNHQLEDRVSLISSDLFENLEGYKFDLILTNPPYVDQRCMDELTAEYLFEPQHALSGGESGLELVEQILNQAPDFLTEHGVLVVEMGDNKEDLEDLYPNLPFTWLDTTSGDGFVFILTRQDLISGLA